MKKLIFFCVLLANPAFAEEWWEASNQAGGKIVLTTQTADFCSKNSWIAYIETTKQDAIYGCWVVSNDRIHVRYRNGTVKIYDKEGWVYKNDNK
jgi:hypothetical protein